MAQLAGWVRQLFPLLESLVNLLEKLLLLHLKIRLITLHSGRDALEGTCKVLPWKLCTLLCSTWASRCLIVCPCLVGEEGAASTWPVSGLLAWPLALHSPMSSGVLQRFKWKLLNFFNYFYYFFPVADMLDCNFLSRQSNYNAVASLKLKMYL